jgi:chromosome segregation ATPase
MKHLGLVVILGIVLGLAAAAEPAPVQLAPAQDEVKALQEAWTKVLKVFEEFLVEFKGAVDTLNNNDQDLLSKYRALSGQLKDLEAKLLQLQDMCNQKIPALEKSLSDCLSQLAALRKSVDDVVAGYQAADSALEAKLTGLIGELRKSLENAIAGYQAADNELAGKIATLATQMDQLSKSLENAIAGYQAADNELAGKIATLATQMDQLSSRVSVLESYDIGNLSRRVLSLEQAIQAVQIKIDNNREKIAALEKTIGSLTQDVSTLKESVLTLETRVSDHDTRISDLESKLGTNVQDLSGRLDTVQALAVLGLLAGIGAIVLVLLGIGK